MLVQRLITYYAIRIDNFNTVCENELIVRLNQWICTCIIAVNIYNIIYQWYIDRGIGIVVEKSDKHTRFP